MPRWSSIGGSRHIWGRLGEACAQLTHAWVKFSWVAQRRFLTAPSVCHCLNCPPPCRGEQRMGRIAHGSDSHSQHLDPLLRGRTERFRGGWTVQLLWGRIVAICKCLWGKSLQFRMVRVGVSQCLNRSGLIIKAPKHIQVDTREKILFSVHTYTCVVMYHCIQYGLYFCTCRSM